ncbi:MAG: hypothetical protein EXR77_06715 [Myxococcales bacterium]|nr:hypothetical protein [Myxococcales bacterium]
MSAPAQRVNAAPGGKSKVVQALIAAAQKEFDAGNFERAGELFWEIWRHDPEARPILYNAARAFQLAGKIEKADELFGELLAITDLDPVLKGKAQNQVEGLLVKRSELKADEAGRAEKASQYALAAGLWAEAIRLQPKKIAWVLRQARAYHLAGQLQLALATYDKYLTAAPATAEDRPQVQTWRDECVAKPPVAIATPEPPAPERPGEKLPEKPVASPPDRPVDGYAAVTPSAAVSPAPDVPKPPVKAPPSSDSGLGAWLATGGGAAALVGGVVMLALATGDKADLAAKQKPGSDGKIRDITHAEATAESQRISRNLAIGWALSGVGAVGVAVGAWLLSRPAAGAVAVVPTGDGVLISLRF